MKHTVAVKKKKHIFCFMQKRPYAKILKFQGETANFWEK